MFFLVVAAYAQQNVDFGSSLVAAHVRELCPDEKNSPAYSECLANLSYAQIVHMCKSLGPGTPELVAELFKTAPQDPYAGTTAEVSWQGCLYNSTTGVHAQAYYWRWDGQYWIMGDVPMIGCEGDKQSSMSAFDDVTEQARCVTQKEYSIRGTFAYQLVPGNPEGTWIARTAYNNQEAINVQIREKGFAPPYCGESRTNLGLPCLTLPVLFVRALSPTLMVVQSLSVNGEDFVTSGIFFRSVTGYTYRSEE